MSVFNFLSDNARWIGGAFLLTLFSSFGQTFFISLSAGEIRSEYGLSHGQFGLLYMVATLCSALTLPWMGKIVDRFTPAQVTMMIVPMLALGAVGMAFSTHVAALVLSIYLLRLFGQAMMTQNALTATARWFAANRGKAISFVTIGHNVGEAVLPFTFVFVAGAVGWRNSWLVAAALLIVFALPVITKLVAKDRERQSSDPEPKVVAVRDWTRPEALRDIFFWLLLIGMLAPAFIGTTIFFHQVYLVELRGWSLTIFASAFSVMAMFTIGFVLVSGALVDRFSAVALLPSFLIPLSLACFVLGGFDAQWSVFVFMALLGTSYGFSSTLFGAVWPEIYGTKYLGSIRAITVAMMVFATAAGPGLTGWLIDIGVSYSSQIIVMGVYCVVACGIMTFVSKGLLRRNATT
ncbi:MFS transporter [Ahrensia kielensis]|uniref:MFS transporter n=1 Tax=Ahrensia kielensis TaxID=76980 RepID=UPI00037AEE8D|nr:MFS transporter [Ahrensia kielensis]